MIQESEREFYTVPEAARLLHVSQATVWRWIEARRLPAYRVGPRRIRIRKPDLETVIRPVQIGEATKGPRGGEETADIWANYQAERVRVALRRSAGALAEVDRSELMADLRTARQQDSAGRPA